MANKARVTVRKGLRAAIRSKTDTAMDFVMLQGLLHRNASQTMQPEVRVALTALRKGTDVQLLAAYLMSCHLVVDVSGDYITVHA